MEDDYNCSGMCYPGLFYFTNPISYGPPKDTCMNVFLTHMNNEARSFAVIQILTGSLCLGLFLFHFGLYQRPLPQQYNINHPNFRNQLSFWLHLRKNYRQNEIPKNNDDIMKYSHRIPQESMEHSIGVPSSQIELNEVKLDMEQRPMQEVPE